MPLPPSGPPPWTIDYVLAVDRSSTIEEAEHIEREVFRQAFDCEPELWAAEYPPYDDRSVWITLRHRGRMVGVVRAIVGRPEGLKIANDLERFWGVSLAEAVARHGLPPDLTFIETATMTVLPEDRTLDRWWPIRALSAAYLHFVIDSGATHAVQLLDPTVLRALTMMVGVWFEPLADLEPADYQGLMQPTVSPVQDYFTSITTGDEEYRRLLLDRDPSGRGGTRLPVVDVTESSPLALHARLLETPAPRPAPASEHRSGAGSEGR